MKIIFYLALSIYYLIIFLLLGIIGFVLLEPFLSDYIDPLLIKILFFTISGIYTAMRYKKFYNFLNTEKEPPTESETKTKQKDTLFFGVFAFLMAIFGYSGMLHYKYADIPPSVGGTMCLLAGIFLIWSYFKS